MEIVCMYSAKYILYWILSGFTFGEKMKRYSTQMNESKFKEIYHQYKSSGLPKEEFCKVYGYTKSTFYCWLRKWGDGSDIRDSKIKSPIAPIMLIDKPSNELVVDNINTDHPDSRSSMELEIVHLTGLKIKMRGIIDLDVFKTLLNQL